MRPAFRFNSPTLRQAYLDDYKTQPCFSCSQVSNHSVSNLLVQGKFGVNYGPCWTPLAPVPEFLFGQLVIEPQATYWRNHCRLVRYVSFKMERKRDAPVARTAILLAAFLLVRYAGASHPDGIDKSGKGSLVSYWGQGADSQVEGTLSDTCLSGHYNIIVLAFLAVFGNDQTPQLNLANHCDPFSNGCIGLSSDIHTCQQHGVKVFLSIGGASGSYELTSASDAKTVATYLWDNYLGGGSGSRPLGPAVLDGIDFDIEGGSPTYYSTLAQTLKSFAAAAGLTLHLSAAPQCPFPDAYDGPGTGTALQSGLFDYVWIQFYNNYCQFQGGLAQELSVWKQWSAALPGSKIFLGLPASSNAANSGFVASDVLISEILPKIKQASNYGGIMLWSVYYDQISSYSSAITAAL